MAVNIMEEAASFFLDLEDTHTHTLYNKNYQKNSIRLRMSGIWEGLEEEQERQSGIIIYELKCILLGTSECKLQCSLRVQKKTYSKHRT